MPFNVRDGINIFLAGYIGPENIRFREEELNFKLVSLQCALFCLVSMKASGIS